MCVRMLYFLIAKKKQKARYKIHERAEKSEKDTHTLEFVSKAYNI